MKASKKLVESVDHIANKFVVNTTCDYLGCKIHISRKQEPFSYVTATGKKATKSARYWGYITYPDGTREDFTSARGGAIARMCGIYVREEHDAKARAKETQSVWECARKFFRENPDARPE